MPYTADPTYYEILDLEPKANAEEIKAAWLRAAKTLHPDSGGSAAMFVIAQKAYATLSDPFLRADYDRQLAGPAEPDEPRPGPDGNASNGGPGSADRDGPAWDPDFTNPPVYSGRGSTRRGPSRRRRLRPRRRVSLAYELFQFGWLGLGLLVALRNAVLVLEDRPAALSPLASLAHFGVAIGVFVLTAAVCLALMAVLDRVRWIYRFAIAAAIFTFPYWWWSPLGVVGLWVAYEGFRLLVWPPPTARLRSWLAGRSR